MPGGERGAGAVELGAGILPLRCWLALEQISFIPWPLTSESLQPANPLPHVLADAVDRQLADAGGCEREASAAEGAATKLRVRLGRLSP